MTHPLLAHGFGDVGDLPITLPVLLYLSGGLVIGVAGLLSARESAGRPERRRRPVALPAVATAIADHRGTRAAVRLGAATLLGLAGVTAALGVDDFLRNPAPALFYTVFWVGVLLVGSLLTGPLWRVANPLRGVSAGIARAAGDPADTLVRPLPAGTGLWPAAGALAVFAWMEVVGARQPVTVLVFLAAYVLVQVGAATVYGRAWYAHGDGFEVYSTIVGWLAPLGRGEDGRLALRSPRATLAGAPLAPGFLAVLAVPAGLHIFDSVADTLAWQQLAFDIPRVVAGTGGLIACIAVAALLLGATTRAEFLRPALVPVVVAYGLAHYFGPLLVETQIAAVALSDPFTRGADLFGLAGRRITYEVVPAGLAAAGQILAFLGFHVLAVAVAHDRAVARHDPRTARAVQFPLRALLVASAVGGVALRFAGS